MSQDLRIDCSYVPLSRFRAAIFYLTENVKTRFSKRAVVPELPKMRSTPHATAPAGRSRSRGTQKKHIGCESSEVLEWEPLSWSRDTAPYLGRPNSLTKVMWHQVPPLVTYAPAPAPAPAPPAPAPPSKLAAQITGVSNGVRGSLFDSSVRLHFRNPTDEFSAKISVGGSVASRQGDRTVRRTSSAYSAAPAEYSASRSEAVSVRALRWLYFPIHLPASRT